MKQKDINPLEALQRIKLMMEYDMSKTLSENKAIIDEQDIAAKTAVATGTAAAAGAGAGALKIGATTAAGKLAGTLGSAIAGKSVAAGGSAALAIGGGIVAAAAALALTPLIVWYLDKDNAKNKVAKIFNYCSTEKSKIDKIERGLGDVEIRNLSDKLHDAMKGMGTKEKDVYDAFKSLKTASDFCALSDRFNRDYGSEGDLLEWLDDDFDQTSEWMQIYRPIRDIVEDTLLKLGEEFEEDCAKNPNQPKCKQENEQENQEGQSKYKYCKGPRFEIYCVSEKIRQLQGCIGAKADSYYGPETLTKLKTKISDIDTRQNNYIDSAEIDKICAGNTPTPPEPTKPEVPEYNQEDIVINPSGGAEFYDVNPNDL